MSVYKNIIIGLILCMLMGHLEARTLVGYNSVQEMIDANAIIIENDMLNLSQLGLTSLEGIGAIPGAEGVKYLYLNGNQLTGIPEEAFNRYESLEFLDLSDNPLKVVPDAVFVPVPTLKTLLLNGIALKTVPKSLLEQNILLEDFGISGDALTELPERLLENQSELKTFVASNSSLSALPEKFFWGAPNLTFIDLSYNKIKAIAPEQFSPLLKLESVDLSYNKITDLPEELFSKNLALQAVMIKENPVASQPVDVLRAIIPEQAWSDVPALVPERPFSVNDLIEGIKSTGGNIGDTLTRTETEQEDPANQYIVLDLTNRGLTNLDGIEKLPKILFEEAAAGGPDIEHLRGVVDLGKDIQRIILRNNFIADLPDGIFMPFPNLRFLDAGDNRLTVIPPYLFGKGTKNSLEDLDLSNNQIEHLVTQVRVKKPAAEGAQESNAETTVNVNPFDSYPQLLKIFLVDNSIKVVPEHILDTVPLLKEIHLEGNHITSLPKDLFARNPSLEVIHLQDNRLFHLPAPLFQGLYFVREIDVSGNMLGSLKQYVFPATAAVTFYPQNPSPLKVLAAKAYHEKFMRELGLAQAVE